MSQALKIVFAGTPAFAVAALEALLASTHQVVAIYTQPDRPAGRGRHLQPGPVKECALRHGLPVEQPATLRSDAAVSTLASYGADVMIVVAYGLLLPPAILAVPRLGCLNIHASLLPRWRGAAPIQRALLAGDERTGVGVMQMEEGLDTGPVFLERVIDIGKHETAGSLHDRLAALGAEALLETLTGMVERTLIPQPQAATGATYARKILKDEAVLDWTRSADEIDRRIRAFNPVPGAETRWQGQQLKVWEAEPVELAHSALPGTVLAATADGIVVAAGENAVRLTRIQLAGRKATTAADFVNANRIVGDSFSSPAAGPAGGK